MAENFSPATEFRAWRDRLQLSQGEAADLLGRTVRQIRTYDQDDDLPRIIRLAIAALERLPTETLVELGINPSWRCRDSR